MASNPWLSSVNAVSAKPAASGVDANADVEATSNQSVTGVWQTLMPERIAQSEQSRGVDASDDADEE